MKRVDFLAMMDSVKRSITAVKSAARISAAAAHAFGNEQSALQSVHDSLEKIAMHNDIDID